MSHELASTRGKAAIAFKGALPWHGLGQELTSGASIETWVKEAGLDYDLVSTEVRYNIGGAAKTQAASFPSRQVIYRSDTGTPLSVVSDKYKVTQPREVVEFFRDLAEERGFELETAGALFGGARYWALARTPFTVSLGGKDMIKAYFLMASSCDSSIPNLGKYTATRVVCNNTISLALGESGGNVVKQSHRSAFKPVEMKQELGLAEASFQMFSDDAKRLAKRKVSDKEAIDYLIKVLGDSSKPVEDQKDAKIIAKVHALFAGSGIGADMSSAKGTAWGLVNSVTQYIDHEKGSSQDRRLFNAWFTSVGEGLKQKALAAAVELV